MSNKNADQMVLELLQKVEDKKKQIGNAERPSWITNCVFKYNTNSNEGINIQTVRDLETLIDIVGFLTSKLNSFKEATDILKLNPHDVSFKYGGFTYPEWISDIQTRINQIRIKTKKDELAKLEERVNALVTPEQRREIELAKLVKEMN